MGAEKGTAGLVEEALAATAGSVEDLAEEVGVSAHTLWGWAKGRRSPRPENLRKLTEVLEQRGRRLRSLAEELGGEADS